MKSRTLITASGALLAVGAIAVRRRAKNSDVTTRRMHAARAVTIRRDAGELYDLFRDSARLPQFFTGLKAVEAIDECRQRWRFEGQGHRVAIELEIVDAQRPERFEWRTTPKSRLQAGGSFTLTPAPGGRGTQARLALYAEGPGSHAASSVGRFFGMSLPQVAMESLRRFKALAEAGEVPQAVRA